MNYPYEMTSQWPAVAVVRKTRDLESSNQIENCNPSNLQIFPSSLQSAGKISHVYIRNTKHCSARTAQRKCLSKLPAHQNQTLTRMLWEWTCYFSFTFYAILPLDSKASDTSSRSNENVIMGSEDCKIDRAF